MNRHILLQLPMTDLFNIRLAEKFRFPSYGRPFPGDLNFYVHAGQAGNPKPDSGPNPGYRSVHVEELSDANRGHNYVESRYFRKTIRNWNKCTHRHQQDDAFSKRTR
uniref:Uncharacterized protein n=1 Tax=Romanomermis culicivorax TaxID=13658 RepID=A0A915HKF1_ROMCU